MKPELFLSFDFWCGFFLVLMMGSCASRRIYCEWTDCKASALINIKDSKILFEQEIPDIPDLPDLRSIETERDDG